jgi:hypothetical protein
LLGMGAVYLVVTLSMFFNPVLREMNKRTQVADGASTQDKTG